MTRKDGRLSRRDLLAGAALAGATAGLAGAQEPATRPAPSARPESRARVVLIRDEKVLTAEGSGDGAVLQRMLDEGVKALLAEKEAAAAWRRLVGPADTLGIKSNVWRFLPVPKELEEAIRRRAIEAGVAADRISTGDRGVLRDPVFAKATALINVRTLRTHHWSGVGSCIKNYIMFHPKPAAWHDDSCAGLAGLWDLPQVKGKTRLNILVMLTPLFHGKGPHHFQPEYTWPYKGLLLGTDPVAVDATGVRILEARRRQFFGKDEPFAVPPKHIAVAEQKFRLGVADPARIDLVKLGWPEGALI